ncbi:MAG: rhomboid family intramembrane serine protease [Bacteroidia bacterium]|nr:rhomboid family intramembrane serine protease [Bacteroidia bacterium]MDW8334645.1 rhomboid family intramembrane serine protease [Bacteroidia bacterium]
MPSEISVSGAILAVTLAVSLTDFFTGFGLRNRLMLNPYLIHHHRQYYRIFTSALIHGDLFHLAVNMFTFYSFGPYLERTIGGAKMAYLYLFAVAASTLTTVFKHRNNPSYNALGASGAVSAVLMSFIVFYPTATLGVMLVLPMPAWAFALLYVGFSWYMAKRGGDGIAHEAHLWGALSGLAVTFVFYPDLTLQTLTLRRFF